MRSFYKGLRYLIFTIILGTLCTGVLFALQPGAAVETTAVGTMELIKEFAKLLWNIRTMGLMAILMGSIALLMKFINHGWVDRKLNKLDQKEKALGRKIKQIVLVVLGVVMGILTSLGTGVPIIEAIMIGLVASGGASSIYNAVKAFFPSKTKPPLPG